jgi:hypothetical protein
MRRVQYSGDAQNKQRLFLQTLLNKSFVTEKHCVFWEGKINYNYQVEKSHNSEL